MQGVWIFGRGRKTGSLALPADFGEPIRQLLVFGGWIVGCGTTKMQVWRLGSRYLSSIADDEPLEPYTTLHTLPSSATAGQGHHLSGGICSMPTYVNKMFAGRADGWVEIWNVSSAKLLYTILPPSAKSSGAVRCLEPTPALDLLAISYASGELVIRNVRTDVAVLSLQAGTPETPVTTISFRTDGRGAGKDGKEEGVMATASEAGGDVTFWDLNGGGRVAGVLHSAHNPPSLARREAGGRVAATVRGGISRIHFPPAQDIVITGGLDNALKTWIFDDGARYSAVPRILHIRSGHAAPVTCLQFLPSDFDGAEAGNKWLLTGGEDRSLYGWSLRRDGQSTELSQGNIRKQAKKHGILANMSTNGRDVSTTLEDLKAPEITCIACSLNRDGGIGAMPGSLPMWLKGAAGQARKWDAELSGSTGWESVVTGHRNDAYARTWFWGRKRAGRWAFRTGDGEHVSAVAVSPCGSFAVIGSAGGAIDMFNLQSGLHRQRFPSSMTPAQIRQAKAHQLRQLDAAMRLQADAPVRFAPGTGRHTRAITGIVVDSMNKYVISCALDGKVKFWDFLTGHLVDQIDWTLVTAPTACRYHPANGLIAFACEDHTIRVVDMDTRRTIRHFVPARPSPINDFCFSNDGRWIVSACKDATIRVWDLPTGHLIDAMRLERPCTSLAFSNTGDFLAAAPEGELGVNIWTNRALFTHVPTRQVSELDMAHVTAGPTASGEGGYALIDAAYEEDTTVEDEYADKAPSSALDQLSADLTTLSLVPRSRWQTLLHLDLIKQRNKPKEPPKAPEKAPFFLSAAVNGGPDKTEAEKRGEPDKPASKLLNFDRSRFQQTFTAKLLAGAASGNCESPWSSSSLLLPPPLPLFHITRPQKYQCLAHTHSSDDDFVEHLKTMSPSATDLELRSLSAGHGNDDSQNELLLFVRAMTARIAARRDYELVHVWMSVFLRLHYDSILESEPLRDVLAQWRERQQAERARLDDLVGYCAGVVAFLRSPTT